MKSALEDIRDKLIPVMKRHGVTRAAVFGSFVRGEETALSDIDVLVDLPEDSTLFDLTRLKLDLEEVVGRTVDVLTYEGIHPSLRKRILDEQVSVL